MCFLFIYFRYYAYCSLRGKQVYHLPAELLGGVEHVLVICYTTRPLSKVVVMSSEYDDLTIILLCLFVPGSNS